MSDLQEGLKIVTEAVKEDSAGNYEAAVQLYERAFQLLEKAAVVEQGPNRATIQQKLKEYRSRCEALREKIEKKDLAARMAKLGIGTLPSQRVEQRAHSSSQSSKPTREEPPKEQLQFSIPEIVEVSSPEPIIPIQQSKPQYEYIEEPRMTLSMEPPKSYASTASTLASLKSADLMTKSQALQTASELSVKATEEDKAGRLTDALQIYEKSLDYFLRVLKEENDPGIRSSLSTTMRRYLDRAEQIKQMVNFANTQGLGSELKLCDFCKKPIGLTEDFKVSSESKLYHLKCFEGTVGLEREETRKFLTGGSLTLRVSISKRIFKPGEELTFQTFVDNRSNKRVLCITAYVLKTETVMHVVTNKHGVERKAKTKIDKIGKRDYHGVNSLFPMEQGTAQLKGAFVIPADLAPTELATTANYAREYDLIIKCKLQGLHEHHKVIFPIRVEK